MFAHLNEISINYSSLLEKNNIEHSNADQHDLDHHVKVSSGAKFLILSRMLNQPESLSDKIPLSSSLKGKELALNWGRQNINHTQRVLLSIHHQIAIEAFFPFNMSRQNLP